MAGSSGFGVTGVEGSFDLTPMIDVILLLIIFFMLTAQFSRSEQKPIDLPRESGDEIVEDVKPSEVIIDLTRNGVLSVRGREFGIEELASVVGVGAEAAGGAAGGRKPMVVVRADRLGRAEHLNRLAAELVRLGVDSWKLGTMPSGAVPGGSR